MSGVGNTARNVVERTIVATGSAENRKNNLCFFFIAYTYICIQNYVKSMTANIFGRYVWLIDLFRHHDRLTYEEINDHWHKSGLSYGDKDDLALRTFHNHRKAIFDIFSVEIACDIKGGYKYFIDNLEELERDNLRIWLIDSYTALNQIQADRKLKGRIIFENVPSGHKWLNVITDAMHNNYIAYYPPQIRKTRTK